MRKKIIAGNWKMNKTVPEAVDLASEIVLMASGVDDVDIVICPAYVCLSDISRVIANTNVMLGAQDLHWEPKGAFTGKVSASMLKSVNVEYVIIGHSEQRQYFGETNESVNKKVKAAIEEGLKPIICVGEKLEERNSDKTEDVVRSHIFGAYSGLTEKHAFETIIAYEPVWAIGTGLSATPKQAQDVHHFIRGLLKDLFSARLAESLRIQYGGSLTPENAKELFSQMDIDGGLIGGASLNADSFLSIILYNRFK